MSLSKFCFAARLALPRISFLVPNRNCSACLDDSNKSTSAGAGDTQTGLVVGVYECNKQLEMSPALEALDRQADGKLSGYFNQLQGQLKLGKPYIVTDVMPEFGAIAITSLGPRDAGYDRLEDLDVGRENVRVGVGAAVRALSKRGVTKCSVAVSHHHDAAAEAAELAAWKFQDLKLPENREPTTTVAPYGSGSSDAECPPPEESCGGDPPPRCPPADWSVGAVRGKCQNWARYLSDMPANKMTPVDFAQEVIDVLCPLGVKVVAHDLHWMEAQRMECFLAVARGSCQDPIFLEVEYTGTGKEQNSVLIAAKGVTFDSGGLCLKKPSWMLENRASMSGAAAAVAAVRTLAELKIPANVTCCIPLCENMISGQCMKVGDIVRALNGLSIMIEDTDMEGKLLLADALIYGQYRHKPSVVVDLATCTHGIKLATAGGAFGCFTNSDAAWRCVRESGACTGDRPWRMPLWNYYDAFISDDPAVDLKNRGTSRGAPCIGAAFLRNFICTDWVHMDITGVGKLAHKSAPSYYDPERMTGRPTRTLTQFITEISANSIQKMNQKRAEGQACS